MRVKGAQAKRVSGGQEVQNVRVRAGMEGESEELGVYGGRRRARAIFMGEIFRITVTEERARGV